MIRAKLGLFLTGFIQVVLVAINVYQVSHRKVIGSIVVGFLISLVWTFNVKRIAFGDIYDKLVYASGAGVGTGIGLLFSYIIYG